MIYFIDSAPLTDMSETFCSQTHNQECSANHEVELTQKSNCANYLEFYERCQKKRAIINSKLDRLNSYFKNKYPNFPGISLFDDFEKN